MNGKTVLVTGATSGIGEHAALELARMGATVIVHGRSAVKAEHTVTRIKQKSGSQNVSYLLADLADQVYVRDLARSFTDRFDRLDVLLNNAATVNLWRELSPDGIEVTFAVNHLAYFLLTHLLLDTLKASAPSRVVNVASSAHYDGRIAFDDLGLERGYAPMKAYGQSKLANVLFTFELARRLDRSGVTANAVHPGFVRTGLGSDNGWLAGVLGQLAMLTALPVEKGADTPVYLAASPEVEGVSGEYFVNKRPVRSSSASHDPELARRLWEVSARMTGLAG